MVLGPRTSKFNPAPLRLRRWTRRALRKTELSTETVRDTQGDRDVSGAGWGEHRAEGGGQMFLPAGQRWRRCRQVWVSRVLSSVSGQELLILGRATQPWAGL